jgi:hypothetical protein
LEQARKISETIFDYYRWTFEVRNEGTSSSFSNHLLCIGHSSEIKNLKILHFEPKGKKPNLLETIEIVKAQKRGENLLNEQLDFYMSPLLRLITDYNFQVSSYGQFYFF